MRNFKNLYVWQKSHEFVLEIYTITRDFPNEEKYNDLDNKLSEIKNGIRSNGIVCLVINSDVKETEKATGKEIPAQFEVNLQTEKLQAVLKEKFSDFEIMKTAVSEQQYDIPRGDIISDLKTKVVTFVARKK